MLTENVDFSAVYTAKADANTGVGGVKVALLVPEPGSASLFLGAGALLLLRRRR